MLRDTELILSLLLSLFYFVSCDDNMGEIKSVAYNYCIATSQYDFERAKHYCTDETKKTTLLIANDVMSMLDTGYIAKDTPASIEIISTNILSDSSALVVYHKTTPIKDFTDTLELRKRDGNWLAHSPIVKNNTTVQ